MSINKAGTASKPRRSARSPVSAANSKVGRCTRKHTSTAAAYDAWGGARLPALAVTSPKMRGRAWLLVDVAPMGKRRAR